MQFAIRSEMLRVGLQILALGVLIGAAMRLDDKQKAIARKMKGAGVSVTTIAETLGVARSTLYRNLG